MPVTELPGRPVDRIAAPQPAREHLLALLPGILHSRDAAEGLRSFTERHEGRFTGH